MAVWLFSSGPLGPPEHLTPEGDLADIAKLTSLVGALEHRVGCDPQNSCGLSYGTVGQRGDEAASELAERRARRGCELAIEAALRARPISVTGKPAPTIIRIADGHDAAVPAVSSVRSLGRPEARRLFVAVVGVHGVAASARPP